MALAAAPLARRLSRSSLLRRISTDSASSLVARLERARGAPLAERTALASELSSRWICTAGEPQKTPDAGDSFGFTLQLALPDGRVDLGVLRAALFPAPTRERRVEGHLHTALLFGVACHPSLPLSLAGPALVDAARSELHRHGAERVMAVAALSGLCQSVVEEESWSQIEDGEAAGAVKAVALGVPRPGHSVLGRGTFAAAQPAFESLALAYARRDDPDAETAAFTAAGGELSAVHWMHDTTEAAMRDRAGCTASFEFGLFNSPASAALD